MIDKKKNIIRLKIILRSAFYMLDHVRLFSWPRSMEKINTFRSYFFSQLLLYADNLSVVPIFAADRRQSHFV